MIKTIVLLVLGVMLILVVLDRFRKKRDRERYQEIQATTKAANDSGPTQTGKFRVQQMLQKTEPPKTIEPATEESEDNVPLPDPFSRKDQ